MQNVPALKFEKKLETHISGAEDVLEHSIAMTTYRQLDRVRFQMASLSEKLEAMRSGGTNKASEKMKKKLAAAKKKGKR